MYYLVLVLAVVVGLAVTSLTRSKIGRAWESVREDEKVAEAVGVPSIRVKALAYVVGGVIAGLAGAFFATYIGIVNPTSFTFLTSVLILLVVLIGGRGSLVGVFLGALVIQGMPEVLRGIGAPGDRGGPRRAAARSTGPDHAVRRAAGAQRRGLHRRTRPGPRRHRTQRRGQDHRVQLCDRRGGADHRGGTPGR
jgi:ABC-type branched-subunit amino acid transport system permease subunit